MEHKLVELAKARMAVVSQASEGSPEERRDPAVTGRAAAGSSARDPAEVLPFLKRQIHRADEPADRSGMICSGEQTIAFYALTNNDRAKLMELVQAIEGNAKGTLHFDATGVSFNAGPADQDRKFELSSEREWGYSEPINARPRIVILGAGHVGLALSRTMDQLGFHVHLLDDRADLNTLDANQWAHKRSVVDYEKISDVLPDDPDLFVVLVSFGYRTDDILVRQLVLKRFRYLGMMGSAEKIKKLIADMRADGFTEEQLARVRMPIGLPINSKTPEEIAVSIAAEIIGVKNG